MNSLVDGTNFTGRWSTIILVDGLNSLSDGSELADEHILSDCAKNSLDDGQNTLS